MCIRDSLQALIDACSKADAPAKIGLIISNEPRAEGLSRALKAGIPSVVIPHSKYKSRESFEKAITEELTSAKIELVCLAGFMRILTKSFVNFWHNKLINIHPSLLPAYKGLDTHSRVIADGVRISGCTVHYVRSEVDAGPIIVQAAVPVLSDDTPNSLSKRILKVEHDCYPLAINLIAKGQAKISGDHVTIKQKILSPKHIINPDFCD